MTTSGNNGVLRTRREWLNQTGMGLGGMALAKLLVSRAEKAKGV